MHRVWKAVRYSGVGLFFADILSSITSCTDQEQITALLLFFLMLLTGGGGTESAEGGRGSGLVGLGQIAYECEGGDGNQSICVINFDGTGFAQITSAADSSGEDFDLSIN